MSPVAAGLACGCSADVDCEARDGRPMRVYHCPERGCACDKYVMQGCRKYEAGKETADERR